MSLRLLLSSLILLSCVAAQAADNKAAGKDKAAIRKSAASYAKAFNAGDAKALTAHWAVDGEMVDADGQITRGRDALLKRFTRSLADNDGAVLDIVIDSIQLLKADVAIEHGTTRLVQAGQLPITGSYTAVHMKHAHRWLIKSVRQGSVTQPPSHYEQLKQLEWMVGEWIDQDENATIETKCEWTANKNFLMRTFVVSIKDRINTRGTQVIGWDPANKQIRSWMFDSNGGFAQGVWSSGEDRWIIRASGTLADGGQASAIRVIKRIDDNTCTVRSISRQIDDRILPDIDEVTVVRKTAE
jgi:uncharacterized protein (TIGR02246 family)